MNATTPSRGLQRCGMILFLLGLFLAGCAAPKIDWAARIGNYTFDQAVVDLGPPDKQATLGDGSLVAEWLTQRGYNYTSGGYGYYGHHPYRSWGYAGYPAYVGTSPDYFLRLIFSPEGQLTAWKRFSK